MMIIVGDCDYRVLYVTLIDSVLPKSIRIVEKRRTELLTTNNWQ